MDTKLTLKLDKSVIERAKIYAAEQKVSVSSIVENYLKVITSIHKNKNAKEIVITEFVKSISIGKDKIPTDLDYKKERQEYLIEKYK
ncbi:MAG: hypothetical protein H7250_10335 [Flavobacterium sp.]|nr:hypothetical protein [Flavobacterium sp.]